MEYTIILRFGDGQTIRFALPSDGCLGEAKERGLRELKKLRADGISANGATIEDDGGTVISSLDLKKLITFEYLDFLEDNYLAAWT